MGFRQVLAALVLAIMLGGSAQAQSGMIPEASGVNEYWDNRIEMTLDRRKGFAAALLNYCRAVYGALPTNTPSEAEWVQREMNTSDSNRLKRAINSVEYARMTLTNTFSQCVDTLVRVEYFQGQSYTRMETQMWLSLSLSLNQSDSLTTYARTADVDSEKLGIVWLGVFRERVIRAGMAAAYEIK
jgi:hypothetical protein